MDLCLSISSTLSEIIVAPVWRHLSYAIYYRRSIRHLTSQVETLSDRRSTIQEQVDAAERNLERIPPDVQRWLEDVGKKIEEKETYFTEERVSNAWCFNGWCPNLKSRYYLGRKAKRMSLVVNDFLQCGNFQTVSLPALPPGRTSVATHYSEASIQAASTIQEAGTSSVTPQSASAYTTAGTSSEAPKSASAYTAFESRASLIEAVMHALKDDRTNPIVIWGMGGIGKTTLLKEVFKRAKGEGIFNEVAMAGVGRNPEFKKIQGDIAEFLGLTLSGYNLSARAFKLSERLDCDKKVLVILDDVWERIDFEEVGIPPFGNCKILISSRNQDIYMEMETKMNFFVGLLQPHEAWSLFKEMAGSSIESPELRTTAEQILSECDRLPLAISTVGRALHGKSKPTWNDALRQLRRNSPQSIPEVLPRVYSRLEFSYDCMEKKDAKSLFLFCCLYPEGSDIRVEDLVRHGVGLQLYEGITSMEEGRDHVGALIEELKNRSLLLDSNKKECVKMHDVVRDVALHIACLRFQQNDSSRNENRFFVRHGVELNGWRSVDGTGAQQYTCSALITKGTHGDVAELLLLSKGGGTFNEAALEGMEKLKVLEIKNASFLSKGGGTFNEPLKVLESLQTLCLEHGVLGDVSIIGELRTLMILSLRGSYINQLPVSFRNLANLWLLDSTGCISEKQISSGVISSLRNLQELYTLRQVCFGFVTGLEDCFMPTEVVPELLSLCHLTTLEVHLPKISFESLQSSSSTEVHLFDRLERFKICIGHRQRQAKSSYKQLDFEPLDVDRQQDVDPQLDVDSSHNILRLIDFDGNSLAGSCIVRLLKKTETLELQMNELTTEALNVLDGECFSKLKSLLLIGCNALEYVIDTTSTVQCHTFPVLDSLTIFGAKRMRKLCNGESAGLFKELRCVKVSSCASLTSLFPFSVARGLPELEELDIERCPMLEEIIELGEGDQHAEKKVPEMTLPNLIHLNLVNLLNLNLEHLKVEHCRSLGTLFNVEDIAMEAERDSTMLSCLEKMELIGLPMSESIWKTEWEITTFKNLELLRIKDCDTLRSVFPLRMLMQRLQHLKHFNVENCRSLVTLFNFEDIAMEAELDSTILSCLEKMELIGLPMLESIWKTSKITTFMNLEFLHIKECDKLSSVFPLRMLMQSLQHLKHLKVENCRSLVTLFDFKDLAREAELDSTMLSCLEKMELIGLPMLESIWKTSKITTFMNLEFLHIKECDKLSSVFPLRMLMQSLKHLKHFNVENCRSLVTLFDFKDLARKAELDSTMLSCLEKMELIGLPMLESIWKTESKIIAFQNLVFLQIQSCGILKCVFPLYIAERLVNLEEFLISFCGSMEEIICRNEGNGVDEVETRNGELFSQLKVLTLKYLNGLTRFCGATSTIELPLLTELQMITVPTLKTFVANQSYNTTESQFRSHIFNEMVRADLESCGGGWSWGTRLRADIGGGWQMLLVKKLGDDFGLVAQEDESGGEGLDTGG
ncbi:putative disease resistance protein [Morus notabilis]|uniref:Putative disease resistance protein n=1 Tax=Morus notabilis TaxID=981085 RepID=W9RS43_9ROSA|nr:putative disease resistance protein [Morus notabilis]